MQGGQRQKALDGDAVFAAKTTAKTGSGYMDPLRRNSQGFRQLQPVTKRRLCRNCHLQFASLINKGHPVLRLQKSMFLPAKRHC